MSKSMRHAILGVGGVGGLMGACLARSGASVTLVARPESLAQYPEQLQLESAFGNFSMPVSRAAEVPPADVLWITVKATQLEPALHALTRPESVGAIVPLLNGIDHIPLLRSRYGADKVVAATIGVESERVAPGHIIHRTPFARLSISSRGQALLGPTIAQFQQMGFDCRFVDDELTLMWSKLVFLAPLALTSTAGDLTAGQIASDPARRRQLEACVRETGAVATAEGANVDVEAVLAFMMKMPGNSRSSMQKDVAQRKPPELDAIAGPILRGAARHGIDVPATKGLVAAVERRVAGAAPSSK